LDQLDPAELEPGAPRGLLGREAVPPVRLGGALQVKPQLLVQLPFQLRAPEQRPAAVAEVAPPGPEHGQLIPSPRSTPAASPRHSSASTLSCRRPSRVSS